MPAHYYRWKDLPADSPLEKLLRKRVVGDRMMLSHVVLEEGCDVPAHAHENEQIAVVLSGKLRFGLGEPKSPAYETLTVGEGELLHLPANVLHSAFALERTIVLDIFSPPSEETGIDQVDDA